MIPAVESLLIAACSVILLVLAAVYVRDRRVRPTAGGSRLRWGLRWALLVVGAFLLMTVAYDTPWTWLRGITTVMVIVVCGIVLRDLGLTRSDRRGRGHYRPVRHRGTGIDGYRSD